MAWCSAADVRQRARQLRESDGWTDAEIGARISRAEDHLKTIFVPMYGADEVSSWDTDVPTGLKDICADVAAAYALTDAFGESQMEEGKPGAILMQRAKDAIEALRTGEQFLLDANGDPIQMADTRLTKVESTTRESEPTFTMGSKAQDPNEPGTLDWW